MLLKMLKIVKFYFFIVLLICVECRRVKRVVGGLAVECGKQIRVASLQNATNGEHLCGATLINEEFASTAAHCVQGSGYLVQLNNGCDDKPRVIVLEIYTHQLYDKYSRAHDIALLRLERLDLPGLNETVLPEHSFGAGVTQGDMFRNMADMSPRVTEIRYCTVYGYGVKDVSTKELSETLLAADVEIVSLDECTEALGPYMAPDYDSGMMCAVGNGADTCEGDSGGPLICQGLLEGISSHGLGCGAPGVPAVYTSIRAHLAWIQQVIQEN